MYTRLIFLGCIVLLIVYNTFRETEEENDLTLLSLRGPSNLTEAKPVSPKGRWVSRRLVILYFSLLGLAFAAGLLMPLVGTENALLWVLLFAPLGPVVPLLIGLSAEDWTDVIVGCLGAGAISGFLMRALGKMGKPPKIIVGPYLLYLSFACLFLFPVWWIASLLSLGGLVLTALGVREAIRTRSSRNGQYAMHQRTGS
jgi:hypothetical protein